MSEKHTPGPWEPSFPDDQTSVWSHAFAPPVFICNCGEKNEEANALLIAAAPDLLAALKLVASQLTTIDNIANEEACEAVKAAIAKATATK